MRLQKAERPNIFLENGLPKKIDMSCLTEQGETFIAHVPLSVEKYRALLQK